MWQPSEAQQSRIEAVTDWLLANMPSLWRFDDWLDPKYGCLRDGMTLGGGKMETLWPVTLGALRTAFGEAELHRYLTDFYCFPAANRLSKHRDPNYQSYYIHLLINDCLERYFQKNRDDDSQRLMLERVRHILRTPLAAAENPQAHRYDLCGAFFVPDLRNLCLILEKNLDFAAYETECRALLTGEWQAEIGDDEIKSSYALYYNYLGVLVRPAMLPLLARDAFSYEEYRRLMRGTPEFIESELLTEPDTEQDNLGQQRLRNYTHRLAWEAAQALDAPNLRVLNQFYYTPPTEGKWLVKGCEHIEANGYSVKEVGNTYEPLSRALLFMLGIAGLGAEESDDSLAEQLKRFSAKTLWLVFPFAGAGQKAVLHALGEEDLRTFHEYFFHLAGAQPYTPKPSTRDFSNSENPQSGVINQTELAAALKTVTGKEKSLEQYFKTLKGSLIGFKNSLLLVQAFRGEQRESIEKSVTKHFQTAIKAYGLLPLDSRQDLIDRYAMLKRVWKAASQYGAERQANTRAAVSAGLSNLATRAGYRDPARLEWDLEAEISQGAPQGTQTLGEWEVTVAFEGIKPVLRVSKQGKALKSVPAGLRKLPEYAPLKETLERLKEQAGRFRRSLEQMMNDGERIPLAEVEKLTRIPAVAFLLGNLLGLDEQGHLGFIEPASLSLHDGTHSVPIAGALRIAHVHDLYTRDCLSEWQQRIVAGQRVQPFKQVFRELYLLTPAEQETSTYSNRFAGHTINSSVAYRLLQGRGWNFTSGDEVEVYKRLPEANALAYWVFADAWHFFTEQDTLNTDQLAFLRKREAVPLADIPPRVFSEIMRDADLVVSVANVSEDNTYWSSELRQHRASVARTIAENLGLAGVRFEDNFAFVAGKLASYRIHLGSGNIHIGDGNYLCIVPDRSQSKTDSLYLPFADADAKITEILSKILLLKNDHKIQDETILAQIRRGK